MKSWIFVHEKMVLTWIAGSYLEVARASIFSMQLHFFGEAGMGGNANPPRRLRWPLRQRANANISKNGEAGQRENQPASRFALTGHDHNNQRKEFSEAVHNRVQATRVALSGLPRGRPQIVEAAIA